MAQGGVETSGPIRLEDRVILALAVIFLVMTALMMVFPMWLGIVQRPLPMSEVWYLSFTLLAAVLGFALIRTLRAARREVIPRQDREVLDAAMQKATDPISEYIRLSSLLGVTGFFRKLEFSGMPLATILMTLILCLLSLLSYILNAYLADTPIPSELANGFFELAKLTLGAFIGSFVAKAGRGDAVESSGTTGTSESEK